MLIHKTLIRVRVGDTKLNDNCLSLDNDLIDRSSDMDLGDDDIDN